LGSLFGGDLRSHFRQLARTGLKHAFAGHLPQNLQYAYQHLPGRLRNELLLARNDLLDLALQGQYLAFLVPVLLNDLVDLEVGNNGLGGFDSNLVIIVTKIIGISKLDDRHLIGLKMGNYRKLFKLPESEKQGFERLGSQGGETSGTFCPNLCVPIPGKPFDEDQLRLGAKLGYARHRSLKISTEAIKKYAKRPAFADLKCGQKTIIHL